MPTVGQVTEKISELRSKIAVMEGVVFYLKTHYTGPEGGKPEQVFTRSDYAVVPELHVQAAMADYVDALDTLRAELVQWENLPVQMPQPVPEPASQVEEPKPLPAEAAPPPAEAQPKGNGHDAEKKTKEPHGAARRHPNQSTPRLDPAGKNG